VVLEAEGEAEDVVLDAEGVEARHLQTVTGNLQRRMMTSHHPLSLFLRPQA
jgi:hypothetical protein